MNRPFKPTMVQGFVRLLLVAVLAPQASGVAIGAPPLDVKIEPSPVVLGRNPTVTFTVRGLAGAERVYGDANVGSVEGVETVGDTLRVHYRPPAATFPQMLCLALWRDAGIDTKVHVIRVPLLGQTRIPVKTRPGSTVKVLVGEQMFGPVDAGTLGQVNVPVLVAPGAPGALVQVTDAVGLVTEKRVAISQPSYNTVALVVTPRRSLGNRPQLRLTVAVALPEIVHEPPVLIVGQTVIPTVQLEPGLYSGLWAPARRPAGTELPIRIELPGHAASTRHASIGVSPESLTVNVLRVRPEMQGGSDRLRADLGVHLGLVHNLGQLTAPRLGVEVGLEYELAVGWVGLRVLTSFSWSTQEVDAGATLEAARSRVTLIPIGGAVTYRLPLRHINPYVLWGCMAQIVRIQNEASYAPETRRTDVAFGVMGMGGADYPLGPGRLFLQLGYLWSRVDTEDVALLAGGLVLDGGYRLEL